MERLSSLSLNIMSACDPYIKPGGRMMFYTCTISPIENGQTVRKFIDSMGGKYSIAQSGGINMELQIMPYYLDSEGGYVCVLKKKDD
jgi:16S rRNA C967 or C1407 C5-methylase (RsmB/RsmF family)